MHRDFIMHLHLRSRDCIPMPSVVPSLQNAKVLNQARCYFRACYVVDRFDQRSRSAFLVLHGSIPFYSPLVAANRRDHPVTKRDSPPIAKQRSIDRIQRSAADKLDHAFTGRIASERHETVIALSYSLATAAQLASPCAPSTVRLRRMPEGDTAVARAITQIFVRHPRNYLAVHHCLCFLPL